MAQAPQKSQPFGKGVTVDVLKKGDGKTFPKKGDKLQMHYTGTFHGGPKHGETFDSSRTRGKPFSFTIGKGQVIKGWDEGVMKMSLGEKSNLKISWDYGYGEDGYPDPHQSGEYVIPQKQDLLFEVELLKIN